jgi:5,10-methenyltetrahydromethanopterin hydrogenase
MLTSLDRIAGVEALRDAQRIFEAAGFVIVPREPTKDMLDAGLEGAYPKDIYRAMIEAAPKFV